MPNPPRQVAANTQGLFAVGSTFRLLNNHASDPSGHLWAIVKKVPVLNTSSTVIAVNFTTVRGRRSDDNSCVAQVGDHPYFAHASFVAYDRIVHIDAARQAQMVQEAMANPPGVEFYVSISAALLAQIIAGAHTSKYISGVNRTLLTT